jgi:hypothetical protein
LVEELCGVAGEVEEPPPLPSPLAGREYERARFQIKIPLHSPLERGRGVFKRVRVR